MIFLLLATLIAAPGPARTKRTPSAPAVPQQLSDVELRERVEAYLGAIDRAVPAERWKALGPRAAPVLEEIIADTSQFPSRRARAVDGLVAAAPDRAAAIVGKLVRDDKEQGIVRIAAMHGAAKLFPSARALSELRPVLNSARSAGLRGEAADLMSRKGGCAEVRDQAARENAEHRGAFERALERCKE